MAIVLDGTTGITTPDLTDTSLTSGRVVYAGTGGNLTGASTFTFDGNTVRNNQSTSTNSYFRTTSGTVDVYYGAATSGLSSGAVIGTFSNNDVVLYTNSSERARFNTTGAFVLAGGTTTANGIGITFPATQSASSNANTLDDYEEGTWTPSLGGSTTYYNQEARYTKIGNLVFIRGNLHINAIGTGSASQISGLPFSPDYSNQSIGLGFFNSMPTSVVSFYFSTSSSTLLNARGLTAAGTSDAIVNVFQNGTQILFSGVYRTS